MAATQRQVIVGSMLLGLVSSTGCYSGLSEFGNDEGELSGGDAGEDAGEDVGEEGGDDGLGPADELPTPTTRFFRLTHQQWENSVQDLLGLSEPTGFSSEFRADPFEGGFIFDNNAVALEVDQALWSGYQRAAVDVAVMVADDPSIIDFIAPPQADEAARARTFVETFGLRAFRRPLSETEVTDFVALFDRGDELYEDTTGFAAGVRLVLEAILQSPHFLYRVERSEEIVDDVIPLDEWEVASRLSFFLWNTTPDDELLDAAAAGRLDDAEMIREQALRMVDSDKAHDVVRSFHDQLLQVQRFGSANPSPMFYPDAPENLGALATQELGMFLEHVVFGENGSWRDLLISTQTFVNDELAPLYGLSGDFSSEFERVELDPTERRGLFTQIGFLAANSTAVNPDPIHRGVFLAKHILCHQISAPPDDIPPVPAPDPTQTNREAVVALTEIEGSECIGCHKSLINPFGFAYENYDAVGSFRTLDNDRDVDATATVLLGDAAVPVDDAVDLAEAMAEDTKVHHCYAKHWMEFAMARPHSDNDDPLLDRLADGSLADLSVKDLMVEMATSRPFLTRAAEEIE